MIPYSPSTLPSATAKLQHFVRYFEGVMDELSGAMPAGSNIPTNAFRPSWPPPLAEQFKAAWADAKPDVDAVVAALSSGDLDLPAHGLEGVQLDFKLQAIRNASIELENAETIGVWGPIKKWLKKLLQLIDILLKSILATVPSGGALEELKSVAEVHVDDLEDEGLAAP